MYHLAAFSFLAFVVVLFSINNMFAEAADSSKFDVPDPFGFTFSVGVGLSYFKVSDPSIEGGKFNGYLYLRPGIRVKRVTGYLEFHYTFMPFYCPTNYDSTCHTLTIVGKGIRIQLSERHSIMLSSGHVRYGGPVYDAVIERNTFRTISGFYYRIAWRINRRSWSNDLMRKVYNNVEVSTIICPSTFRGHSAWGLTIAFGLGK
jgi:hypothetical protein